MNKQLRTILVAYIVLWMVGCACKPQDSWSIELRDGAVLNGSAGDAIAFTLTIVGDVELPVVWEPQNLPDWITPHFGAQMLRVIGVVPVETDPTTVTLLFEAEDAAHIRKNHAVTLNIAPPVNP